MKIIDIYDIQLLNRQKGFYFFSLDTMQFFNSRVAQIAYLNNAGTFAYFVISERFSEKTKRLYTIRKCNMRTGSVNSVSKFQEYKTSKTAHKYAIQFAEGE